MKTDSMTSPVPQPVADAKRTTLIETMAAHLLAHGFDGFTLRRLGEVTHTSDRMLLHYFENKDALLNATLARVLQQLLDMLTKAQLAPTTPQHLITQMAAMLQTPSIQPFTNLWLELCQRATRQGAPYAQAAKQIATYYMDWIEPHLRIDDPVARRQAAAFVFAVVEGLVVMHAAGLGEQTPAVLDWLQAS